MKMVNKYQTDEIMDKLVCNIITTSIGFDMLSDSEKVLLQQAAIDLELIKMTPFEEMYKNEYKKERYGR